MANRLIFVTYKGGNCGDFFCSMLERALGNEDNSILDDTNRCHYSNPAFAYHGIKGLEEVFRRYNKHKYILAVDQIKVRELLHYLDWTKRIHDYCYDPDRNEFILNVKNFISSNLVVDKPNTVASIHYLEHFEGFTLGSVYDPSIVIQLMTRNPLFNSYFYFLSKHKQRWSVVKRAPDSYSFIDEPPLIDQLPEDVVVIDSGKLFFTDEYDDEAEAILSKELGLEIKFDRQRLNDYRKANDAIMKETFGDDYRKYPFEEFVEMRKRYYMKIRNEV